MGAAIFKSQRRARKAGTLAIAAQAFQDSKKPLTASSASPPPTSSSFPDDGSGLSASIRREEQRREQAATIIQRNARATILNPSRPNTTSTTTTSSSSSSSSSSSPTNPPSTNPSSTTTTTNPSSSSSSSSSKFASFLKRLRRSTSTTSTITTTTTSSSSPSPSYITIPEDVVQACEIFTLLASIGASFRQSVLSFLAFGTNLVPALWQLIKQTQDYEHCTSYLVADLDAPVSVFDVAPHASIPVVTLFASLYAHQLYLLNDYEVFEQQVPFPLDEAARIASFMNLLLFRCCAAQGQHSVHHHAPPASLVRAVKSCLAQLYARDNRHPFCDDNTWLYPARLLDTQAYIDAALTRNQYTWFLSLVQTMPHVIDFHDRVKMLRSNLAQVHAQYGAHPSDFVVRRSRLVEDTIDQTNALSSSIRGRIRVVFIDTFGNREEGIDAGGLMKEWLETVVEETFNPTFGLFATNDTGKLYPSTLSKVIHGDEHIRLFRFVGMMLAKAIYEGIVVELPLAGFFLDRLLGKSSSVEELQTLDKDMYKGLQLVKSFKGDMDDLCLTFSVMEDNLGDPYIVDLIPHGRDVDVTHANKIEYVHRVADYYLNTRIKRQTDAFVQGFRYCMNDEWMALFNRDIELQRLISGDASQMDIDDLAAHTVYDGCSPHDPVVQWFWQAVADMDGNQRRKMLKFVTSVSNAPIGGFKFLEPAFRIRVVDVGSNERSSSGSSSSSSASSSGGGFRSFLGGLKHQVSGDIDRIPSASTCFNLLKLPRYKHKSTLVEKLDLAINSNAGFDLA